MTDIVERLNDTEADDHERLTCPARYAVCQCGNNALVDGLLKEAASEITRLREEVDALRAIAERLNDGRVIIDEELTWEMMKNLPSGEPF